MKIHSAIIELLLCGRTRTHDEMGSLSEVYMSKHKVCVYHYCFYSRACHSKQNCFIPRYVTWATKEPPVHKSRSQQKRISLASPKLYQPMYRMFVDNSLQGTAL